MSGRLCGTRLFAAADDDRAVAFLLSDLHVPQDGGQVLAALQTVLDAAAPHGEAARVLLLGDLFDSYVGRRQLQVGVWREVAARLRAAAGRGVSITCLHGNRDFLLDTAFERAAGCRVVAGGLWCKLAGRRALLLHGDELCQNDLPYQRAKRWLRSPPVRWLSRALPLRAGLWAAARARQKSRQVVAAGDPARFHPTAAAVRQAFALGAELLVFGHIHRPARGGFAGGEYLVLPAFDEAGVGLRADAAGVRFVRAGPGGLELQPDPAARAFA